MKIRELLESAATYFVVILLIFCLMLGSYPAWRSLQSLHQAREIVRGIRDVFAEAMAEEIR